MIVTISRIQHRMGLQSDLPQLAPGELGWAVDSRRLFIGNGLVADGAPPAYTSPNNTEILTEWSLADLLTSLPLYTYEGNGPISLVTGPDSLHPVQRTIQDRLDDYVSVKAFGALGDGSTNDVAAINRALYELFVHDNTNYNKKVLFFPAGTYAVNDVIKLPRNARIAGEGIDCTFITQTASTTTTMLYTADSLQQIETNIGTNGASYPGNNHIANLTLTHINRVRDIALIDQADTVTFDNVKFVNQWTTGNGNATGAQAVKIISAVSHISKNIKFNNCEFEGHEYVNRLDYDANNISFSNCKFTMCYRMASLGENLTFAGVQSRGPWGYKIINCYFDSVYETAIKTFYGVSTVVSGFNTFNDVGNNNTGIGGYIWPLITFVDSGNQSMGDYSLRQDNQDAVPNYNIKGAQNIAFTTTTGLLLNRWQKGISNEVTLNDNQTASTGITKDYNYWTNLEVNYTIQRGGNIRFGRLRVVGIAGGLVLSDDFDEAAGSVGVTFSLINTVGTIYDVKYTTTSTGSSAIMEYQINSMR